MNFIFDLHHTMMSENLILAYQGDFTQETTKSILAMAERNLDASSEDPGIKRKVFNVMVESLQNIVKHSEEHDREKNAGATAGFFISRSENGYSIMSGNPIRKTRVSDLKETLERINALDKEGLRDLYKEIIQRNTLSEKGGAGLGFVDMIKKSGEKLRFDFPEISQEWCLFCLKVNVPRE